MSTKIIRGFLGAALLAGVVWLSPGAAMAANSGIDEVSIDYTDNPRHCYKEEFYLEYQWKRIETTPAVEEISVTEYRWDIETRTEIRQPQIEKQVKGRIQTKVRGDWENTGTFDWIDYPDAGPLYDDARIGTSGPHSSTFNQTGNGNGSTRYVSTSYRYVETGVTRSYTPPRYTAWAPTGSTSWGPSSTPPADTATTRYVNKQEWTRITQEYIPGFDTEFYYTGLAEEGIGGSPYAADAVWTEYNPGEPWTQFNERQSVRGLEVPCPPVTTVPETTAPETTVPGDTTTTTTTVVATDTTPTTPPASVTPTVPPTLPSTGSQTTTFAWIAAAALVAGLIALAISWVRPDYPDKA